MKPIKFSTVLAQSKTLRSFQLALVAPAMVLTMTMAQAGTPAPTTPAEPAVPANWITFTIGGSFISGDDAGYMRRTGTNDNFYGGIEDMKFTHALNDSTTLTLDGHAMPGLEDYEFNMDLEKTDLGFVKAGYKQFRTWYDGSGGFKPGAGGQYGQPYSDEMSVDRGELYLQTGLRKENLPEITFTYRHTFRDGQKDSTMWSEGLASNVLNRFKNMPSYWDIDESSDIFELEIEHTIGNTDLGGGLVYEHSSYTNSNVYARGNSTANPVPSGGIASYKTAVKTDDTSMDLWAGNIHSVTRFNDKLWLTTGFAVNSLDTDNDNSSRVFSSPYITPSDTSYDNMTGGGLVSQMIGNLNVMWNPITDLTVTPSIRYEHEETDSWAGIRNYKPDGSSPATYPQYPIHASNKDLDSTVGALDIRYTGISNLVLYAKGMWGSESEDVLIAQTNYTNNWLRSDIQTDEQEYVIGANWYALSGLSFSVQGLHSERDQDLDHTVMKPPTTAVPVPAPSSTTTIRPIMVEHDTEIDDFNMRMTWRPMSNLSLVTRYDYCNTEYSNRGSTLNPVAGNPATPETPGTILAEIESGDVTSHILSQSMTWSPMTNLYVQGTFSYISSETATPSTYVLDSDNDYITGTLTVGYAIDDRTNITASYTYYGDNNYVAGTTTNTGGVAGMGYGLNTEESAINVTLTRVLTPNMIWNLRYGFITSDTDGVDQSGGYNDFDAHMVSTGLQIRF